MCFECNLERQLDKEKTIVHHSRDIRFFRIKTQVSGTSHDPDFGAEDLNEPHRLNQAELSDLIRDLDLPKQKRQSFWHSDLAMITPTRRHVQKTREKSLLHFFDKKGHVVSCIDVNTVVQEHQLRSK
ncbi:hypothetical protein TNIN_238371 [Trichonephila inaurata madagascariensis]|uniref:Uncharacterized protein n=1 Tax=Trichonephila inaurata madagascariensis TaxID=2747483 RepID=A0A8X6XVG1_9ARAC|nr:hypothetical protein TNIN_238371 [Trichonephila inaurata madagascariensis]